MTETGDRKAQDWSPEVRTPRLPYTAIDTAINSSPQEPIEAYAGDNQNEKGLLRPTTADLADNSNRT